MASMDKVLGDHEARAAILSRSNNPFAGGIAYVEGQYIPLAHARIPLVDTGFLKSDLTYDAPGVWDGRFFRLDDHLDRLEVSCKKLRLKLPLTKAVIKDALIDMVSRSSIRDANIQIIVTRGLVNLRWGKAEELENNLYMFVKPWSWTMPPPMQKTGGSAIIARTVRRTPVGSMDPTVKNLQWGDFIRGMLEAEDRNSVFPFLLDGDGYLTEGAGFNILIVKDGVLYTPSRGVLEGVTRRSVVHIANSKGIEVQIDFLPVEAAYSADEIFLCSTSGGIMPIVELDGRPVADGNPGLVTRVIWDGYWQLHWDPAFSFEVDYK